jgi:NhaP-type Na+/H+ or K+/H+ antiporter
MLICLNLFVNNILKKIRDKWPKAGMFIQNSPVSVIFGLGFGYLVYRFQGQDVAVKLRKSFEPLFMNFFLPFIINDGAVNAFPKKSFFKNIMPVLVFAIFGTTIAIGTTAMMFKSLSLFDIIQKVKYA